MLLKDMSLGEYIRHPRKTGKIMQLRSIMGNEYFLVNIKNEDDFLFYPETAPVDKVTNV